MQRNGACQYMSMCIRLPLCTFRNHNWKYSLKWKHQRTWFWPCADITLLTSVELLVLIYTSMGSKSTASRHLEQRGFPWQGWWIGSQRLFFFANLLFWVSVRDYFLLLCLLPGVCECAMSGVVVGSLLVGMVSSSAETLRWRTNQPNKKEVCWITSHNVFPLTKPDRNT